MFELRSYQSDLVDRADAAFEGGVRSVVLVSPTGSGKTATASEIIRRRVLGGRRVLFLAHLDMLLEDTHARLTRAGVWSSIFQAGRPAQPLAPVQVCSLQTLHARGERPAADFVILDECHRGAAPSVRALLADYAAVPLLGLTATPQRGDGQPLGDLFERLIVGPSAAELTRQGYLVPCDLVAPAAPVEGALAMDPVDAWFAHTPNARALVFAKNVRHAETITLRFQKRGVSAECITGETSRAVRSGLRGRLEADETRVLVSVAVFLEGFDAACIESIILARSFGTCGAYLQAIGRGLRPSPSTRKERCTVLDLAGAVYLHGLPEDDRRWSLHGETGRRTGTALEPIRRCGKCFALFRQARVCPRCGVGAPASTTIKPVLTRAERLELINALPSHERDRRYLETLLGVAMIRMRLSRIAAEQWALAAFKKRRGREPERSAA